MSKRVWGLLSIAGCLVVSLIFLLKELNISEDLLTLSIEKSDKNIQNSDKKIRDESGPTGIVDKNFEERRKKSQETTGSEINYGGNESDASLLSAQKICNRSLHQDEFNETVVRVVKVLERKDCVSCLIEFKKIRSLNLRRQKISVLQPLVFFEFLEELNLSGNDIIDPAPLAKLDLLSKLDLSENEISDPGRIARIKNLSVLNIRKNDLDSLTGFSKLTNLKVLDSQDNRISDLNPLKKNHKLTEVRFWGNPIERHRPRSLCPRGSGVAAVIHHFCIAHHRIKKSRADYSKPAYQNARLPLRVSSSKRHLVFPGEQVEIWDVNYETKQILTKVLDDWIALATKAKKMEFMPESARISTLMRTYITDDDEGPDADDGSDEDSMFLVAVANRKIQALALLADDEKFTYAKNLKFLTVAPHNLGIEVGEISYKYVGSSVVEKALEITGKITLEPGSTSSSTAYMRMGFTSLSKDHPLSELGDGVIKGDQARSLSEKLKALRQNSPKP